MGNIEFGYRLAADRKHLEPNPREQAALTAIRKLRARGATLRGIAKELNATDHRTRRGTPWRLESVARVINVDAVRRPSNAA